MSIGSRLKEARISKKITQTDLASAIGVTKGAIGNYETDVSSPKEDILIRLMKYLDIDANYLYQDYMSTADGALTFQFSDDEYLEYYSDMLRENKILRKKLKNIQEDFEE